MHRSPHEEGTERILGLKGVFEASAPQAASDPEGAQVSLGGGLAVFFERTLVPGLLELEVSLGWVALPDEWAVPFEMLLKKPFHFGRLTPYLALGPTAVVLVPRDGGETEVAWGGAVALGTYLWPWSSGARRDWGLDVDVTYALLAQGGVLHEVTVALAVVHRF